MVDALLFLIPAVITALFAIIIILLFAGFVVLLYDFAFGRKKNVSNKEDNAEVPAARPEGVSLHKNKKH